MKTWKTKDGRQIEIKDMETSHIKNTLAMLKRKGFISPKTLSYYLFGPTPNGDGANDAYEMEFNNLVNRPISPFINYFEDELIRRKNHITSK